MKENVNVVDFLTKVIPGTVVSRWTLKEDHEEIILKDSNNNLYEINFYPRSFFGK